MPVLKHYKCSVLYRYSTDLEQESETTLEIYQGIQLTTEDNYGDHALDCCHMGVSWYVKIRYLAI